MIVTSSSNEAKSAMFAFLREHGVEIAASTDFQALGRLNSQGKLIGVVGYNGFCGRTCMMHTAGEGNWISRTLLWAAFDYPFNQTKCIQVFATVPDDNQRAMKLDCHLGFTQMAYIKDGWTEGVGLSILTMHKSECRWLTKLERKHELQAA